MQCKCGNYLTVEDRFICSECRRSGKPITTMVEAVEARDAQAQHAMVRMRLRALANEARSIVATFRVSRVA